MVMLAKTTPCLRASREKLCRKRPVVAVLVTRSGQTIIGGNRISKPQPKCPRVERGYKDGEGWKLCRDICGQIAHAEIDALSQAGDRAIGGTLHLLGHRIACVACAKALAEAGVDLKIVTETYSEDALTDLLTTLAADHQEPL